jgi:hypothetical protein
LGNEVISGGFQSPKGSKGGKKKILKKKKIVGFLFIFWFQSVVAKKT